MDGVLVVDKPEGLTSHDVVAAARRALGERRIGHTGTLDPLATGVLPLAIGRATRLARFLTASDKDYDAVIRFGLTTDSYDITGTATGRTDMAPPRDRVIAALESLRGDSMQMPPAHSAKKVGGRRAYALARRAEPVVLQAVPVHVSRVDLVELEGTRARVTLTCSAGFYVRSFAHTLGERTGTGACLEALRRTRSGDFGLDGSVPMETFAEPAQLAEASIPTERLLPRFPGVTVTARGRTFVTHGRTLEPADYQPSRPLEVRAAVEESRPPAALPFTVREDQWIRIFDESGALLAVGQPGRTPGSLHPSVVLI